MLSRYRIVRGKRPADDPLPDGLRQDARKHGRHCLRPEAAMVEAYLDRPDEPAWRRFRRDYLALLGRRIAEDRTPFETLAAQAGDVDVFIGCSCPTAKNPDVRRCHTWLALEFMRERFPGLAVEFPDVAEG